MAPESLDLGKDEPEILKPTSPPSPSSSSSPPSNLTTSQAASQSSTQLSPAFFPLKPSQDLCAAPAVKPSSLPNPAEEPRQRTQVGNRCSTCRKRVGLTGFRCRCGDLFCARHRYSDAHHCSFDYKAAGREEISKANPLIRPAKIIKI